MSEFSDFIYVDCKAEIACSRCGDMKDASGGSEREVEGRLSNVLSRSGWHIVDGQPHCPGCVRKTEAKPRQRRRRV
jgi:hypothetical protein